MLTAKQIDAIIEALVKMRDNADDKTALDALALFPSWRTDTEYKTGDRVKYNDVLYKCNQEHKSQSDWDPENTYSLWAKVLIPDDNQIYPWEQPESTNPYKIGDKVTHNGKTWVSIVDVNTWEPGVYGWEELTDA